MSARARLLTAAALVVGAVCASSLPVRAQDTDRFTGSYRFAGGSAERAALERAVHTVCDAMDPLSRVFAHPQILERVLPVDTLRIESSGERHVFVLGPWGPVHVRLGGDARRVRNERDETVLVSARWDRGRLWYIRQTERGVRSDALHLSDDGRVLTIDSTVESPHFPVPLRFRLTYRREE